MCPSIAVPTAAIFKHVSLKRLVGVRLDSAAFLTLEVVSSRYRMLGRGYGRVHIPTSMAWILWVDRGCSGGTDRVLTGFELCGRATGRPGRHLRTGIALAVRVCIPRLKRPFSSFPRTTRLRRAPQPALLTTSRALRASHWATRDPSRQPRPKQAPPKSPK